MNVVRKGREGRAYSKVRRSKRKLEGLSLETQLGIQDDSEELGAVVS